MCLRNEAVESCTPLYRFVEGNIAVLLLSE